MTEVSLKQEFLSLHAEKGSILSRCEEYSTVTLPYVFPQDSSKNAELQSQMDSVGARAVNFLTNKLVLTLFPENQPFFRLQIASDMLEKMVSAAKNNDEQASQILSQIDSALAAKERACIQKLGYTRFRTEATHATRLLIITGNALMYHPTDESSPQVYSLRDYCLERDLMGTPLKIMTRDKKGFGTFTDAVQKSLQVGRKKPYKATEQVTLYTQIELGVDGKYHLKQAVENIDLDSEGTYTKDDLPWKPLAWNLVRGEDYGHGLVEDYFGTFHALSILSRALVTGVGIAAEVKFLVNPASVLDVKQLNASDSGTYHTGNKDDISCIQLDKAMDFQMVSQAIVSLEKNIAAAFLMNSSVTRNAERVTAEEIRYVAQELETANAGVYSRLALEWQYPTAVMLLARVGTKVTQDSEIQPQIITGIDALSRAGDLDNLRAAIADMSTLNEVPEEMRIAIDARKMWEFVCVRRGVEHMKFTKTQAQIEQEKQAEMQQQQQLQGSQAQAAIAVEAGKAAVQKG